jgi:hypothetical protein
MLHLMLQMHAPFHGGIPFHSIDKDPSIFAARHHPLIVLEKRVHKGRGMDGWVEERERVCVKVEGFGVPTNLMISTCSSKTESTGLDVQRENLKACMAQPHWLLHNHGHSLRLFSSAPPRPGPCVSRASQSFSQMVF